MPSLLHVLTTVSLLPPLSFLHVLRTFFDTLTLVDVLRTFFDTLTSP